MNKYIAYAKVRWLGGYYQYTFHICSKRNRTLEVGLDLYHDLISNVTTLGRLLHTFVSRAVGVNIRYEQLVACFDGN